MVVKTAAKKSERPAKTGMAKAAVTKAPTGTELDGLIHDRVRLGILSVLAVEANLSFSDLKKTLKVTDGNLSVHARKLEEAGYISCRKRFEGRMPRTDYRLTAKGKTALQKYLAHMEAIISHVKQG